MAEADGNRTRQDRMPTLTGFEDRGAHQERVRLHQRKCALTCTDADTSPYRCCPLRTAGTPPVPVLLARIWHVSAPCPRQSLGWRGDRVYITWKTDMGNHLSWVPAADVERRPA